MSRLRRYERISIENQRFRSNRVSLIQHFRQKCSAVKINEKQDCFLIWDHPRMRALVRRSHFRSRDEDGDHTIQSAIAKNPTLHANLTSVLYGIGVIADWSFTLREYGISRSLLLWPWPWSDDLHNTNLTRIPSTFARRPKTKFLRQGLRKLSCYIHTQRQTNRHTDRQTPTKLLPRRFACGNKLKSKTNTSVKDPKPGSGSQNGGFATKFFGACMWDRTAFAVVCF